MIAQTTEFVIQHHLSVSVNKVSLVKIAQKELAQKIAVESKKGTAIMENASVSTVLLVQLAISKHALIHVQIMENALKENVNVNLAIRVWIALFKHVLMIALEMEFVLAPQCLNVLVIMVSLVLIVLKGNA